MVTQILPVIQGYQINTTTHCLRPFRIPVQLVQMFPRRLRILPVCQINVALFEAFVIPPFDIWVRQCRHCKMAPFFRGRWLVSTDLCHPRLVRLYLVQKSYVCLGSLIKRDNSSDEEREQQRAKHAAKWPHPDAFAVWLRSHVSQFPNLAFLFSLWCHPLWNQVTDKGLAAIAVEVVAALTQREGVDLTAAGADNGNCGDGE